MIPPPQQARFDLPSRSKKKCKNAEPHPPAATGLSARSLGPHHHHATITQVQILPFSAPIAWRLHASSGTFAMCARVRTELAAPSYKIDTGHVQFVKCADAVPSETTTEILISPPSESSSAFHPCV
jgi:hypothetical protein